MAAAPKQSKPRHVRVLVTGFTPFPGAPENPTSDLVSAIQAGRLTTPGNISVQAVLLPTEYEASVARLEEELLQIKPDVLLEFGLSAKARGFTLERLARNEMTSSHPDNSGFKGDDGRIDASGPPAFSTGLPLKKIHAALKEAGLPADYSDSAGGYVCNHLFYRTMQSKQPERPAVAGFIHIPYLEEQRDRLQSEGRIAEDLAAMSEAELFEGVEIILRVMVTCNALH